MTAKNAAVYEHGVFHPTEPAEIADGEAVQLVVLRRKDGAPAMAAASILAQIAALPLESAADETTSRDHDRILYGSDGS